MVKNQNSALRVLPYRFSTTVIQRRRLGAWFMPSDKQNYGHVGRTDYHFPRCESTVDYAPFVTREEVGERRFLCCC